MNFKDFLLLNETFISIGINKSHDKFREQYRDQIRDIISLSYAKIGGYKALGTNSDAEHKEINDLIDDSLIKAIVRNGKMTAVNMYKDRLGRKIIASGSDGTQKGKDDWWLIQVEDNEQERSWGEVSHALEYIYKTHIKNRKTGNTMPVISADKAEKITGKKINKILPDGEHYEREIAGKMLTKTIMGFPKVS